MATAAVRGLKNVTVYTGDIAHFDLPKEHHGTADRVISIEMFEHMKNYERLMAKIATWVKPGGKVCCKNANAHNRLRHNLMLECCVAVSI